MSSAKRSVITEAPPELVDDICDSPGIWPSWRSSGAVTLEVITSGLAPRGVANAAEIAAVDGVDAVFIGPADLSTGMGHAGDASQGEVQDAIRRTVEATLAAGKACGILAPREEDARRYADWGCRFIAVGIDISLLRQAALANLGRYRATQATDQAAPASRTY